MTSLNKLGFILFSLLISAHASAGYIGLRVQNLPEHIRAHLPNGTENTQGVIVDWLEDISPAADDGVQLYDILLSVNGQPITSTNQIISIIQKAELGSKLAFSIIRQGETLDVPVTVTQHPTERMTPAPSQPLLYQPNVNPSQIPQKTNSQFFASNARPLNILGRPSFPMRKKPEVHAWGTERNIWPDFYTDGTNDIWDNMINAPFKMGRMPGGMRAPSLSMPDPVTIGDAVTNQMPPMAEEMGNMMDISDDGD